MLKATWRPGDRDLKIAKMWCSGTGRQMVTKLDCQPFSSGRGIRDLDMTSAITISHDKLFYRCVATMRKR